ncbi:DUF2505 domain-containing protein [Saccharomonospora piscinae]|uniref:DUF2505 domain-containing protein n=1 Tax=Saccharomonospora piscinae TaxID=687388 RepID=UPI000463178D|nr:DUF2505 domain-containing protein [Saccharomonospora piscinae]
MATRIEHRATFAHSLDDVFTAQTDERALRARLDRVGGERAELRDHEVTDRGVRYTLVQGIAADKLPSIVRSLRSGDIAVVRTHIWTRSGDRCTGRVTADVADLPGRITADTDLRPEGDGCVETTRGEVVVRVPLVGGKIEKFVAEQVTDLLEAETRAARQWLAQ